jgi:hypothetical protein
MFTGAPKLSQSSPTDAPSRNIDVVAPDVHRKKASRLMLLVDLRHGGWNLVLNPRQISAPTTPVKISGQQDDAFIVPTCLPQLNSAG